MICNVVFSSTNFQNETYDRKHDGSGNSGSQILMKGTLLTLFWNMSLYQNIVLYTNGINFLICLGFSTDEIAIDVGMKLLSVFFILFGKSNFKLRMMTNIFVCFIQYLCHVQVEMC